MIRKIMTPAMRKALRDANWEVRVSRNTDRLYNTYIRWEDEEGEAMEGFDIFGVAMLHYIAENWRRQWHWEQESYNLWAMLTGRRRKDHDEEKDEGRQFSKRQKNY
ncbi:uncharacterized protein LOC103572221 [Microplitis demolitor]|uniref:uncharacterized protein LOC103572221 n=1 Tax=Microplitis demolitor TaxID=69319 RepID=UPI0004CD13F2|nr:uncharacterized protein LOC103572221 [Microplitis demolitor]